MPKARTANQAKDNALAKLRGSILSGERLPGERLIQEQIAAEYGMSRIPVRDALGALEAEGLVTRETGGGYSVATMDAGTLHSIHRVRRVLEAEAVRMAADSKQLGPALAARMAAIQLALEEADFHDFLKTGSLNRSLHFCLFEACNDAVILRILTNLWDSTDNWRAIYYRLIFATDEVTRHRVFEDQRQVISLVAKGDAEALIAMLDLIRERGIASVEEQVEASYSARSQLQAHLLLNAYREASADR
jgi:DNA-binding GntR family transcriptional regulator